MIADLEACEIIDMPLAADRALTIAERYAFFKAHVTEADRAEFAAEQREANFDLQLSEYNEFCEALGVDDGMANTHALAAWLVIRGKDGAPWMALAEYAK